MSHVNANSRCRRKAASSGSMAFFISGVMGVDESVSIDL
jgi:hypothetical protein